MSKINLYHGDSLEAMKAMPDKCYDLAIVDPPYGMMDMGAQSGGEKGIMKDRAYKMEYLGKWDEQPTEEYFNELFRVSVNQIIWGGNYFDLPPTRGIICWDKCQPFFNFSAWEMGWTSFGGVAKLFKFDNRTGGKIHPTQKPVKLYKWLLKNYAKEGDKILDTHGGSMSIALACYDMDFDIDLWEIDADYYNAGVERYNNHVRFHPKNPLFENFKTDQ
jgi:site-specific DNA-methyltransferase (adenine-specific)